MELPKSGEVAHEDSIDSEVSNQIFSEYSCKSLPKELMSDLSSHPSKIAESNLLNGIDMPHLDYDCSVVKQCGLHNHVSDLQCEGVLYASMRHQQWFPSLGEGKPKKRAGFFLGDGAGVGKGRQLAGIILLAGCRGIKKHIWCSTSADLYHDAERDLKGVNCHYKVINGCNELDKDAHKKLVATSSSSNNSSSNSSSSSSSSSGSSNNSHGTVFFTTYSTLSRKKRFDQLIEWCGGAEFDGVLVFDEAHKAKNAGEGDSTPKEVDGNVVPSQSGNTGSLVARAVIQIQEMCPKARVVYASATGVSSIEDLRYADRLGLWGPCTPYLTFKQFYDAFANKGMGHLELLSMELKARGMFVARGLSWDGAEFDSSTIQADESFQNMYKKCCEFVHKLKRQLDFANRVTGKTAGSQFFGMCQRVFRNLCQACKVTAVVEESRLALGRGESVVIGLQSTGEAGLDRALSRYNQGSKNNLFEKSYSGAQTTFPNILSTAKEMIVNFIDDHFPTTVVSGDTSRTTSANTNASDALFTDPDNYNNINSSTTTQMSAASGVYPTPSSSSQYSTDVGVYPAPYQAPPPLSVAPAVAPKALTTAPIVAVKDDEGKEVEDPELVRIKRELLEEAHALNLPPCPLDALIDQLGGPNDVAELTGRRGRLVSTPNNSSNNNGTKRTGYKFQLRGQGGDELDRLNVVEAKHFNAGKKKIAIISDAASTGISLHASQNAINQSRRHHITFELPWSADKTIQQLGRTHRTFQVSAPVYCVMSSNIGGENRFSAAVSQRLQSLGAISKGDRRAAGPCNIQGSDLFSKYGRMALQQLHDDVSRQVVLARQCVAKALPGSPSAYGVGTEYTFSPMMELVNIDEPKDRGNVKKFLNRILALPIADQNALYQAFFKRLDSCITTARLNGEFDDGVVDIKGTSIRLIEPPMSVYQVPVVNAQTKLYKLEIDRGITFIDALQIYLSKIQSNQKEGRSDQYSGFWSSRRVIAGRTLVLLALQRGSRYDGVNVYRPNTGRASSVLSIDDLRYSYYPITLTGSLKTDLLQNLNPNHANSGPLDLKCMIERTTLYFDLTTEKDNNKENNQNGPESGGFITTSDDTVACSESDNDEVAMKSSHVAEFEAEKVQVGERKKVSSESASISASTSSTSSSTPSSSGQASVVLDLTEIVDKEVENTYTDTITEVVEAQSVESEKEEEKEKVEKEEEEEKEKVKKMVKRTKADVMEITELIENWCKLYITNSRSAWTIDGEAQERIIGGRFVAYSVLSGPVLLVMSKLEKIIKENYKDLTAQERKLRIVRIEVEVEIDVEKETRRDSGGGINVEKVVGLAIPPSLIAVVAESLQEQSIIDRQTNALEIMEDPKPAEKYIKQATTRTQKVLTNFFTVGKGNVSVTNNAQKRSFGQMAVMQTSFNSKTKKNGSNSSVKKSKSISDGNEKKKNVAQSFFGVIDITEE